MQVFVPSIAVSAIYARENGAGTVFTRTPEDMDEYEKTTLEQSSARSIEPAKKLESVKSTEKSLVKQPEASKLTLTPESKTSSTEKSSKANNGKSKPPSLKVIK
jgi:stringent starvation protein B